MVGGAKKLSPMLTSTIVPAGTHVAVAVAGPVVPVRVAVAVGPAGVLEAQEPRAKVSMDDAGRPALQEYWVEDEASFCIPIAPTAVVALPKVP